jgi:hypothetical protein
VEDSVLSVVGDDACAELLLTDGVPMDEESGSNRQLGVCFLYEVLTKRVKLTLLGEDVSLSLGSILSRYAHLKATRWGREAAESGEVESAPSRHFAQLAALIQHQEQHSSSSLSSLASSSVSSWPPLPSDGNSMARFSRGFTLKRSPPPMNPLDPMPRPPPPKTAIHVWFERLDRQFHQHHHTSLRLQLEQEWRSEQTLLSHSNLDRRVLQTVLGRQINHGGGDGIGVGNDRGDASQLALRPGGVTAGVLSRHFYESIAPLDSVVCDTSQALRPFLELDVEGSRGNGNNGGDGGDNDESVGDLESFSSRPLAPVGLDAFVVPRTNPDAVRASSTAAAKLPFDIASHGDAQSAVAKDLLKRLEGDVQGYAAMQAQAKLWDFYGLTQGDVVELFSNPSVDSSAAEAVLKERFQVLERKLLGLVASDSKQATRELGKAVEVANALILQPSFGPAPETAAAAVTAAVDDQEGKSEEQEQEEKSLVSRVRFGLRRSARQFGLLDPSLLTRALMSASACTDLQSVNPFLPTNAASKLLDGLPATLLRFNRVAHAKRALAALSRLKDLLSKLRDLKTKAQAAGAGVAAPAPASAGKGAAAGGGEEGSIAFASLSSSTSGTPSDHHHQQQQQQQQLSKTLSALSNQTKKVQQGAKALVAQLLAERYYVNSEDDGGNEDDGSASKAGVMVTASAAAAQGSTKKKKKRVLLLDPRFLVFEYAFDLLLRARQVEMVRSFVGAAEAGDSRVQQMIMGAGKTTVIGPLLTLLLADGNHLVVQVMPSALLDMSRNVLRKCFTCPLLPKRVYTLSFDRSVDDSAELVAKLRAKLEAAAAQRGVLVAAPEAIKSLVLKLVEQLHSVEQVEMEQLLPTGSNRANRETVRLRDAMVREI